MERGENCGRRLSIGIFRDKMKKRMKRGDGMRKKVALPAGNMLYPLPAVMVSLADKEGRPNIITLAWAGTICSSPPMVSVSIRPERFSYDIIKESGDFVINLTTKKLAFATDYCGVKSGRDVDKFKEMKLTPLPSEKVKAPAISESPINIECRLKEIIKLGSHDAFIAEVVNVRVDESLFDEKNRLHLEKADLIAYSHGRYYGLGEEVGSFGYSIRKKQGGRKEGRAYIATKHSQDKEGKEKGRRVGKSNLKKSGNKQRSNRKSR